MAAHGRTADDRHHRGPHAVAHDAAPLTLTDDGAPPLPLEPAAVESEPAPLQPTGALALAAAAFLAGIVLAALLGTIAVLATGDSTGPALLVASFVGLWIPLVGAALLASRLFGSGSVRRDLGLAIEPNDLFLGVFVGIAGLAAATGVQAGLTWLLPQLVGTNTTFVQEQARTGLGAAVVVLSTCIGAPFVEELFFRGLLQRALHRLGFWAVVLQSLVFGLIHVTPEQGLGNVSIIVGVGTFGLVLGLAARRFGRLGPAMIGHALFNAAAVLPLLFSR